MTPLLIFWLGTALGHFIADPEESIWASLLFLPSFIVGTVLFGALLIVALIAWGVDSIRKRVSKW